MLIARFLPRSPRYIFQIVRLTASRRRQSSCPKLGRAEEAARHFRARGPGCLPASDAWSGDDRWDQMPGAAAARAADMGNV